jgi:hypothetical protein
LDHYGSDKLYLVAHSRDGLSYFSLMKSNQKSSRNAAALHALLVLNAAPFRYAPLGTAKPSFPPALARSVATRPELVLLQEARVSDSNRKPGIPILHRDEDLEWIARAAGNAQSSCRYL